MRLFVRLKKKRKKKTEELKMDEFAKTKSDEIKYQNDYGDGEDEDEDEDETPKTPSPLDKHKKKKKKLKELMHVKSCAQSSNIIKIKNSHTNSTKVLSNHASKSERSKGINSLRKKRAMVQAEEVVSSLDPKFPSFIKPMVRSHVSSCFWMGLSSQFCKSYLPQKDMMITVEDESGKEVQMQYFYQRVGLSGGWRNFAISRKLLEDDIVIFQLVKPLEPIRLKVYIIRANDATNEDGTVVSVNVDAHKQQNDAEKGGTEISQKPIRKYSTKRKLLKSLQHDALQKKKKTGLEESASQTLQLAKKSKNGDEESELLVISGPSYPSSQVQFSGLKSFEDFTIIVDGLCIDSELPDHIRRKYYELCLAKKSFLHARLMPGLNSKLIAGIIFQTVTIADSIKTCNLTTCRGEFASWERALKSFHYMGMSIGFIIARIRKLAGRLFESEDAFESRKYMAAKSERVRAEDELVNLKSKFIELKETYKKCGSDVKALKSKAEGYEHKFQKEVDAPW